MKILLTAGGTREPIDGVRFISNFSSGTTGAIVADRLRQNDYQVVYLHGSGAARPERPGEHLEFGSFSDLEQKLKNLLSTQSFDFVIHMAAVSDFSVTAIGIDGTLRPITGTGKIPSTADAVDLHLTKNKKLLPLLKCWSLNKRTQVIGFKLTNGADEEARMQAVSKLFDQGGIDWVVHNDLTEMGGDNHKATFYGPMGPMRQVNDKTELAEQLAEICEMSSTGGLL